MDVGGHSFNFQTRACVRASATCETVTSSFCFYGFCGFSFCSPRRRAERRAAVHPSARGGGLRLWTRSSSRVSSICRLYGARRLADATTKRSCRWARARTREPPPRTHTLASCQKYHWELWVELCVIIYVSLSHGLRHMNEADRSCASTSSSRSLRKSPSPPAPFSRCLPLLLARGQHGCEQAIFFFLNLLTHPRHRIIALCPTPPRLAPLGPALPLVLSLLLSASLPAFTCFPTLPTSTDATELASKDPQVDVMRREGRARQSAAGQRILRHVASLAQLGGLYACLGMVSASCSWCGAEGSGAERWMERGSRSGHRSSPVEATSLRQRWWPP